MSPTSGQHEGKHGIQGCGLNKAAALRRCKVLIDGEPSVPTPLPNGGLGVRACCASASWTQRDAMRRTHPYSSKAQTQCEIFALSLFDTVSVSGRQSHRQVLDQQRARLRLSTWSLPYGPTTHWLMYGSGGNGLCQGGQTVTWAVMQAPQRALLPWYAAAPS